jgi:hypothetical protein
MERKWFTVHLVHRYSNQATSWTAEDSGFIPGRGKRFFSSEQRIDRLWALPASHAMGSDFSSLFTKKSVVILM